MKALLVFLFVFSLSAQANLCDSYEFSSEKGKALAALATLIGKDLETICNSERILHIEIQPSQIIITGVAVPHYAIYFHYNEDSCKYMVNRSELTLTTARCFPTF